MAYRLVGRVLAAVYQSCDKFLGSTACYFRQLAENGRVGELPTRAGRLPVLPDFSMIISHKHKFIFIKTAKTAGTSIEVYLSKHCGSTDIITPIAPPIAGHQPRNYHGFINPIPEIIEAPGKFLSALRQAVTSREKFYNHMPASEVKSRVPAQVWKNYFKFCVERWQR